MIQALNKRRAGTVSLSILLDILKGKVRKIILDKDQIHIEFVIKIGINKQAKYHNSFQKAWKAL